MSWQLSIMIFLRGEDDSYTFFTNDFEFEVSPFQQAGGVTSTQFADAVTD